MSALTPIPAPRLQLSESKKPVPTPRTSIKQPTIEQTNNAEPCLVEKETQTQINSNTFTRRVKSFSHATKQIRGDIGDMIHDRKKAVIEGTRQSMRRITRKLSSSASLNNENINEHPQDMIDENLDIFGSLRFDSPITVASEGIYNNINQGDCGSSESINLPPPTHPPPPLPDESIYDAPQSIYSASASSNSTSTSGLSNNNNNNILTNSNNNLFPDNYESVFPINLQDNESERDFVSNVGTLGSTSNLSQSESWRYYDSAANVNSEVNSGHPDSTPVLNPVANIDGSGSSNSHFSVELRNSCYENFVIPQTPPKRPTQSVLFQFDPLKKNNNTVNQVEERTQQPEYDMTMLHELLQTDLYGTVTTANTIDNWSISDSDVEDYVNPPPPPVRFDSLPEEDGAPPPYTPREKHKSRTSWFTAEPPKTSNNRESIASVNQQQQEKDNAQKKGSRWLRQVRGVLEKAPDVLRGGSNKDAPIERPSIIIKNSVQKKGMLYKVQNRTVEDLFGEYSGRWCVLENTILTCFSDSNCDNAKENFPAASILSIQILQDPKYKYKYDNDDLHCFELNVTGKSRGGHIYGSRNCSERRKWMQCIAESLTYQFDVKLTSDYTRMGWAYIREGISGKWVGAWLMLCNRVLHYSVDNHRRKEVDLRKARCLALQSYQENENNPRTNDKGPIMLVDCPNRALYLRMWTGRETKVWCHIIKLAAHNNGAKLDQQQLTKNDIPVIVQKCINFVYLNGSMTEGIYRKAGSTSTVSEILTKFSKDAWDVQLTTDSYTEHDVATALKRFFKDLPEPLLSTNQQQYLYQVSLVENQEERIRMYKASLEQLPPISYNTARKVLGHLHFISTQHMRNLMTVDNLASFWGPTLMHNELVDGNDINSTHRQYMAVVAQLITLVHSIFPEDPDETKQEQLMLQVLEKYTKSPQGAINNKKAGDLRVWIYLYNKEGLTYNVAIGPNKTAYEVCAELSSKVNMPVHEILLEEVVLNDKLVRPIHHTEKVLDVVLRWGYWDEADRKENHLVLSQFSKYWEYIQEKPPVPLSAELKFADLKTRQLKILMFEFSQAKLKCYKDRTCEVELSSWNVEDIIWYLGHEVKRNPQTKWTITFIEKKRNPVRTKNLPYFGNILAWLKPQDRACWVGAMLKAMYPNNLTPPPQHVNLLTT